MEADEDFVFLDRTGAPIDDVLEEMNAREVRLGSILLFPLESKTQEQAITFFEQGRAQQGSTGSNQGSYVPCMEVSRLACNHLTSIHSNALAAI